jgi:hypothetical protein
MFQWLKQNDGKRVTHKRKGGNPRRGQPLWALIMKKLTLFLYLLSNWDGTASPPTAALTNHIQIDPSGICLSLSDESLRSEKTEEDLLFDKEIDFDISPQIILHNKTTNQAGILFFGLEYSFAFKLFDAQGREREKTSYGTTMSLGPTNRGDFYGNFSHRLSLVGHGMRIMSFPKLNNLFQQPLEKGDCTLELQFWLWDRGSSRFKLSDPIRVRVTFP